MNRALCQRLWQVEAARDGRLAGSDLSNALRHRAECRDCAEAARALSELGQKLKALPVEPTDTLERRRTRQALLGAWNEHLLSEPRPKFRPGFALTAALCAVAGVALAVGYPLARRAPQASGPAAPHLKTQPGFEPKPREPSRAEPSSRPVAPEQSLTVALATAKPHPSPTSAASRIVRPEPVRPAVEPALNSAEDDAYLQIVELLRSGRAPEARAKAAQYLTRFPNGFRRLEVEKIAQRQTPSQ
jgi:hypothetical protein